MSNKKYEDNRTLKELEQEYETSLNYLEELKNVYTKDGKLDKTNKREALVINVWRDLIEKAILKSGNRKEVYGVISRDFQRFFTDYRRYSDIIQCMWETEDKETKNKYLDFIRRITNFDFLENTFHEGSNNFFKLRKWADTIGDKELTRKINSHLDCIITSLFRQIKGRYGLE